MERAEAYEHIGVFGYASGDEVVYALHLLGSGGYRLNKAFGYAGFGVHIYESSYTAVKVHVEIVKFADVYRGFCGYFVGENVYMSVEYFHGFSFLLC